MILIGLTGGTGGGKSAVSEILAQNGGLILDADKLARKVVESCYTLIHTSMNKDMNNFVNNYLLIS